MTDVKPNKFTGYQIFMIAVLAFIQFTVVLDFMVMSPMGPILRPELHISTSQFALIVSVYAISAAISGLFAAGYADKFDRKKMLLFFYAGFVIGTLLCGVATSYEFLLVARIVTGIFGGVIASISYAIITDLFKLEVRGTVMGFVQTSFAACQALGVPIGLLLANEMGWHAPFLMIVGICVLAGIAIVIYMKPVVAHLAVQSDRNAFQHLGQIVSQPRYLRAFAATMLLATGGFMLMPFGADFAVHNLGLTTKQLPNLYIIIGVFSALGGPLIGKMSDRMGKYKIFVLGSILSSIMVVIYCGLGVTPLWLIAIISIVMFWGISGRMIAASALMTAIPEGRDRGAFMSINSSAQQAAGGVAAIVAGMIIHQQPNGMFERYDILGYVVAGIIILTIFLMYPINKYVVNNQALAAKPESIKPKAESVKPESVRS